VLFWALTALAVASGAAGRREYTNAQPADAVGGSREVFDRLKKTWFNLLVFATLVFAIAGTIGQIRAAIYVLLAALIFALAPHNLFIPSPNNLPLFVGDLLRRMQVLLAALATFTLSIFVQRVLNTSFDRLELDLSPW
jgi:O-antigen ligase